MTPKQWLGIIAEYGPVIEGSGPIQLHHVVGRTYKHNKVLIGPWFVLPLPWQYHDVHSNDPLNVTHYRHRFTDFFGQQSELFNKMCVDMENSGIVLPFDNAVMAAIMDTRR